MAKNKKQSVPGDAREYVVTPEYITTSFRAAVRRKNKIPVSRSEYSRQFRALAALEKTSQLLAIETDIKGILKNIAETIGKALGARYVNFWNFTPNRRNVFILTAYGMQRQYLLHSQHSPLPVGSAWIGRAMKTGQAWATSNILKDPFLPKSWLPAVRKQKYHGLLCAPLIRKKEIVGGMCIYYKKKHVFEYFDMSLATIVANQAATAVENARIFGDLSAERTKTVSIIQSLGDGLIMYDLEGRIIFFNPKAEEYLLVRARGLIGKKIDSLRSAQDAARQNLYAISQLSQRDYETREYVMEKPQRLVFAVSRIPVRDQARQAIGTVVVLHDITREKDVELLKIRFISTASHQLRTPLTGIRWSLDFMLKGNTGPLNSGQVELVSKTLDASTHMTSLVNDLLDTSRIEEGVYGYAFALEDISGVVSGVMQDSELQIEEKKIAVMLKKPEHEFPKVSLDKNKMKIAVQNIIDNAIKYSTPGGEIRVELRTDANFARLVVEDDGIGIPEEDQKFIFNKFFRAKNAIRFESVGSGLGLFITKSIIEKHNGSISIESKENSGTRVTIQFPLDPGKMPKGIIAGI